jgi:hypothetical protein
VAVPGGGGRGAACPCAARPATKLVGRRVMGCAALRRYWGDFRGDVINQATQDFIKASKASRAGGWAARVFSTPPAAGAAASHARTPAAGGPAACSDMRPAVPPRSAERHTRRGADRRQHAALPCAPPPSLLQGHCQRASQVQRVRPSFLCCARLPPCLQLCCSSAAARPAGPLAQRHASWCVCVSQRCET